MLSVQIRPSIAIVFWSAILAGAAAAQVQWTALAAAGPRYSAAAAFDSGRGRLVMFGGDTGVGLSNDTWEWDGTHWQRRLPPQSPPLLYSAQMIYDPGTARCLLLGRVSSTPVQQCWQWDGAMWTRLADAPWQGNLAYDGSVQRPVLLTGALQGTATVREWDGAQWNVRNTTGDQPGWFDIRYWAHDAARGCMVMPSAGQVFELHGGVWQRIQAPSSPPVYMANIYQDLHTVTYDARLGGVVLCGGADPATGSSLGTLAWWNGSQWQSLAPVSPRQDPMVAFDDAHGELLVFGGRDFRNIHQPKWRYLGDLWSFAGAWTLRYDGSSPGHLAGVAAAYDQDRDRVVTFGGSWDAVPTDEAYAFDGERWHRDDLPAQPPAREHAAMAYDRAHARMVLFGGRGSGGVLLGDTWVRGNSGWQGLNLTPSPSPRTGARMVFDQSRGVIVLVGGQLANGSSNETWELGQGGWQLRATGYPPASAFGGLAFDPRRGRTVLHGGYAGDATYEWDGNSWFAQNPAHRPAPDLQRLCAMTYDAARARIVLLATQYPFVGTWEWDGVDWRTTTAVAPARVIASGPSFVFHAGSAACVLLPGADNNWGPYWTTALYASVDAASWQGYGSGCSGGGAAPELQPLEGSLPWIGDAFAVQLQNAGAGLGAIALGFSNTAWNGAPLPLSLAPSMPGCALLASPDWLQLLALTQGTGALGLSIPPAPAIVGVAVYLQGFALAPGANAAGIVTSAAGRARVGAR